MTTSSGKFGRLRLREALAAIAAALAAALAAAAPAHAEPPMWVIEDEDSTIYLFGTVHLLDPDIEWRTGRVMNALDRAGEVWFEIPMPASVEEAQAQMVSPLIGRALSPDRPLSSLLTDEEKTQLTRALARTPAPEQLGMGLENMKPWFATLNLGVTPLLSAGYQAEAGADAVLAGIVHERGVRVRGFETFDQQLDFLSAGSEEEQLDGLRTFLAIDDETFAAELARGDTAFRAWMAGDAAPLESYIAEWKSGESAMAAIMPYGIMVANRNEDWAGQIENILAGEGTVFIAVGAGHLVGPDSVQARLAARGIEASAY